MPVVMLGENSNIGVVYDDSALSEPDLLKSIWLELQTDRPEELKQKIPAIRYQGNRVPG